MSWNNLKSALDAMTAASADGFEGFVGQLLAALLNQPFFPARAGDQPGGDGRSHDGSVRFQTKHYTVSKVPDFDIVADFHRVRTAYPSMETYVVATASQIKEQLRSTLDALELAFGIDIITLNYSTESSSLSVLAIGFWDIAKRFAPLSQMDVSTTHWINSSAQENTVQAEIEKLRVGLTKSVRLFATLRQVAIRRLEERFGICSGDRGSRFEIALNAAVPRTSVQEFVKNWRNSPTQPLLVLVGEEGMGKSWSAAAIAHEWSAEENSTSIWLESHDWAGVASIHELIRLAVEHLPFEGIKDLTHWCRKAEFTWGDRLTVFLDGANEAGALAAAQTLVREVRNGRRFTPRLVFTSRPLQRLHEFSEPVWRGIPQCNIGSFDDAEFAAALASLTRPLRREEIPCALEAWARIPRLLRTCARLRDQFGGLDKVTREVILWADLLDKINQTDPQVRTTLGWRDGEEAAHVLARLASEFLRCGTREIDGSKIAEFFSGDYREVMVALEELRLADKAQQMRTTVNADCNLLGLALLIHERLRLTLDISVRGQSDDFRRLLEPLADVDERTKALFVALQLTAISPPQDIADLSNRRGALLHAWATSRNADVTSSQLQFWCACDVLAYAAFVETLHEERLNASATELVLRPLAERWRACAESHEVLQPLLAHWLLLTWIDAEGTTVALETKLDGHVLPVARYREQLRLTLAAIAIISHRPVPQVLAPLALSRATLEHAVSTRMLAETPVPESERKPHKIQLKLWQANFGALMRFAYTELSMPEMQRLAAEHHHDPTLIRGLQLLVSSLRIEQIPQVLQLPPKQPSFPWKGVPARKLIREGRRLFPESRDDHFVQERNFSDLAVRDDLPELSPEDIAIMVRRTESALCSKEFESRGRSRTEEDYAWEESRAWLAKYSPQSLLDRMSEFRGKAFVWPEPLRAFSAAEDFLHNPAILSTDFLLQQAKEFWMNSSQTAIPERELALAFRLHHLAMFNFSPEELTAWFEFSSADEILRAAIAHYPNIDLLRALLPREIADLSRCRVRELTDEPHSLGERAAGRFDFWARLAAATAAPDELIFDWCLAKIESRQPTGDRKFHWLCLVLGFAPNERLMVGLRDGSLLKLLDHDGCNAAWFMDVALQPNWFSGIKHEELLKRLPIGEVGKVLLGNRDEAGFAQWGRELFGRANELVGYPPFQRRYWGDFVLDFDKSGHVECQSIILAPTNRSQALPPILGSPTGTCLDDFLRHDTEQRNEALRLGNADYSDADASLAADLFGFSGLEALDEWRRRNVVEFLSLGKGFIQKAIECPEHSFHLASLIHATLCNLLVCDPDAAIAMYQRVVGGGLRIQCSTIHKIPQFQAALWNVIECSLPRHRELRKDAVVQARSERELMGIGIAASANGGVAELEQIARECLRSETAKDRAVGVSALAWLGNEGNLATLATIVECDPVLWLRRHAEWAIEVIRRNTSAARFYARVLREQDPAIVSTMLAQLEPALTPLARCWYREVEDEIMKQIHMPDRRLSLLIRFWEIWEQRDEAKIVIAGRNLDEWRYGEEIGRLDAPVPFPFC